MKAFIYKTNQYLLERFPTLWNTRLVWMLLMASVLHILFFVFGYFTLSNPKILQERSIIYIFFENGTVFLSLIISVLILVGWLIYMFKNNAFKNFYPTTSFKLFGQFICYLLILFSCTTFYLSYNYGLKAYIVNTYPDEQINREIEITNDTALFLSEDLNDFTIDNRRFPEPFYDLFCESEERLIDYEQPHFNFLDESYQFYTLRTETEPVNNRNSVAYVEYSNDSIDTGYVYSTIKDSIRTLFFKDAVVDMSAYFKTSQPSYYNSSFTFFISRNDTLNDDNNDLNYNNYKYYEYENYYPKQRFSIRHQLRNQRNYELLERNDKTEIKALLDNFLAFSNYYKIDHNLTTDQWFDLIYNPENFEVKHFIRDEAKPKNEYSGIELDLSQSERFYKKNLTDYYFQNDALRNVFENIEEIKASNPLESIHFFIWFSFFFSCIIFMFRVTGLKPLLFSVLTVGVLILFVTLITAVVFYLIRESDNEAFYFISYFTLFLGTLILAIPLFFINNIKKIIVAICLNISVIGFPLYVLLILGIITMYQDDACRKDNDYYQNYYHCDTLLNSLELNWSFVLFAIALLFLFFYSTVIKQWKSLTEG